jgi:phage terminase small subunit
MLTHRQRAFIDYYVQTWNASESAKLAGYSAKSARSMGSQLLTNLNIKAEIDKRIQERSMSANEVLDRLTEQARNEAAKYVEIKQVKVKWDKDEDESEDEIEEVPGINVAKMIADGKQHLIKGITYNRAGKAIVETYDAQSALVHLGRHYKLFTDKLETDDPKFEAYLKAFQVFTNPASVDKDKDKQNQVASIDTTIPEEGQSEK